MKNLFNHRKNYIWGFILSLIFVTLLVINYVTNQITNNIIDKINSGCDVTFKYLPINRANCHKKSEEARTFISFNENTCSSCEKEGLCLKDLDLQYCEKSFAESKALIKLRSGIKFIVNPIDNYSQAINILIVMGLFVVGFFGRWIIGGLK